MSNSYQQPDPSEDQDDYIREHTEHDPDEMRESIGYLVGNNLQHTSRYKKLMYYFSEEFIDDCRNKEEFEYMMEKDD